MNDADFKTRTLSLARLELIVVDLPQVERFQSAIGVRSSRKALFVRWFDREGAWGIGECSCRPDPFFSHEFLDGAIAVISKHLFPHLNKQGTYGELLAVCNRIRGWNFAKAAVLDAVHDLWRRNGWDDPVSSWNTPRAVAVPVGISLGLYPRSEELVTRIGAALEQGYRRVKIKIKPGMDPDYLRAVRRNFPDAYLGCDANGSFAEEHMGELERLVDLGLAMLEQPFAPDRFDLFAELKRRSPGLCLCADESVAEIGHLLGAIAVGAIDELNIKPGRVGGMLTSIRLAEICRQHQIPVWIGGMFESGIGRAANLRFAACFPDARAHDLSPSTRYFLEDLVAQPLAMDGQGRIPLPQEPVTVMEARLDKYMVRRIEKRK